MARPERRQYTLLAPILDQLERAIDLLGAGPPKISDALVMLRHAGTALQQALDARPDVDDDERREALNLIRKTSRDLRDVRKILGG